jgi:dihydroxyacid dehydratase/phosphogluconate dehydratase
MGFARQCCSGASGGVDTLLRHLAEAGVPVNLDAPTVSGTWRERLLHEGRKAESVGRRASGEGQRGRISDGENAYSGRGDTSQLFRVFSADAIAEKDRILSAEPARETSGTQVFTGSAIGRSAVLKISGLSGKELVAFEDKVALAVYINGEDEAADAIGDVAFLEKMGSTFSDERLGAVRRYNAPDLGETDLRGVDLFERMVEERSLRVLIVIAGEGPVSNGMPEVH